MKQIVFQMTTTPDHKPHDTLPMNRHRWTKQTPGNNNNKIEH
jgi:hypothetical protein